MNKAEVKTVRALVLAMALILAASMAVSCSGDTEYVFVGVPVTDGTPPVTPDVPDQRKPASFGSPMRLAMADPGLLAVSDYNTGRITFVNTVDMTPSSVIGVPGTPMAVGVGRDLIYVGIPERVENGVTRGGNVNAFSMDGRYLFTLGQELGYGLVKRPVDLAVDMAGKKVFVLDAFDKMVKVYGLDGAKQIEFAAGDKPAAIAVDLNGQKVYVSDYGVFVPGGMLGGSLEAKVQVYDKFGASLGSIAADQPGYEFSTPQGMAVDLEQNLYMADVLTGRVLIFNSAGDGVGTLGSLGTGEGELFVPMDVALDEVMGDIFVTNNRMGRIEVFRGAMR